MPEIFISTSCLRGSRDLREILQVYSVHGIENVELSGGLDYVDYVEKVLLKYSRLCFIVHNYFPPVREAFIMNLAAQDDGIRERSVAVCKRAIDLCSRCRFSSRIYSFHPGFRVEKTLGRDFEVMDDRLVPYDAAYSKFTESIEEISEHARSRGVKIAVENLEHKNQAYMMTRPEEFLRFQESFPEVGVLLDLGHLKIASARLGFEVEEFLRAVQDNVLEVHIHENDGRKDLHLEPLNSNLIGLLEVIDCETVVLECRNLNMERIILNLHALEQAYISNQIRFESRVDSGQPGRA